MKIQISVTERREETKMEDRAGVDRCYRKFHVSFYTNCADIVLLIHIDVGTIWPEKKTKYFLLIGWFLRAGFTVINKSAASKRNTFPLSDHQLGPMNGEDR